MSGSQQVDGVMDKDALKKSILIVWPSWKWWMNFRLLLRNQNEERSWFCNTSREMRSTSTSSDRMYFMWIESDSEAIWNFEKYVGQFIMKVRRDSDRSNGSFPYTKVSCSERKFKVSNKRFWRKETVTYTSKEVMYLKRWCFDSSTQPMISTRYIEFALVLEKIQKCQKVVKNLYRSFLLRESRNLQAHRNNLWGIMSLVTRV